MTDEIKHPPSALICEAASLFYLLGGMAAKHLVIVGGLVPPLLVPDAADAHIGSADIDLCLSLAITKGATHEYYRSIEEILEPHFELERASRFRWFKSVTPARSGSSPPRPTPSWAAMIQRMAMTCPGGA